MDYWEIWRRIQAGERAKVKSSFGGFGGKGRLTKCLPCDALEWQSAEGAGAIQRGGPYDQRE